MPDNVEDYKELVKQIWRDEIIADLECAKRQIEQIRANTEVKPKAMQMFEEIIAELTEEGLL